MKVTHIDSASVLLETEGGIKLLCDPWFSDGAFYGAWYHYPPLDIDYLEFQSIDYIYISHIHQDHMDIETLRKLPPVPILILEYEQPFLKKILSQLPNQVIELKHKSPFHDRDLVVTIFAADNCDPEVCNTHFECAVSVKGYKKTMGIDSLALFEDRDHAVLNTNDCPWPLSRHVCKEIDRDIDLLLVGYQGASSYPQCFANYSSEQVREAARQKRDKMIRWAKNYINLVNPRWFIPFAGEYYLGGDRYPLNHLRGVPDKEELPELFNHDTRLILLNRSGQIDLRSGAHDGFIAEDPDKRWDYIKNVLSRKKYPYQEKEVVARDFLPDLKEAHKNLLRKLQEWGYTTETNVYIRTLDSTYHIPFWDQEPSLVDELEYPYVKIYLDSRLLDMILNREAHWNNAELGSHLIFARHPDIYERGVYYFLSYLHK